MTPKIAIVQVYPAKLKGTGKGLSKCIKFGTKWLTPNEFESLAGMHQAKKWKQSITCEGKALGVWLAEFGNDTTLESSQKCAQQPENAQVQIVQEPEASNCSEHNELGEEDKGMQSANESACKQHSPQTMSKHPSSPSETSAVILSLPSSSPCSDLNQLLKNLEAQLSASLKEIINRAIQALREHVEATLQCLKDEIEALTIRVCKLEEQASSSQTCNSTDPIGASMNGSNEIATTQKGDLPHVSYASAVAQDQILELQSKVETISSKQVQLEKAKEREKRKCNVLLGNLHENGGEGADEVVEKVMQVFTEKLKIRHTPTHAMRIGKKGVERNRLVLVRMNSFKEKIEVLKAAKHLKGSDMFLMEDLSKSERDYRKTLVKAMKKARSEGKKAFIRFTDGKLIVNGKAVENPSFSPLTPQLEMNTQ